MAWAPDLVFLGSATVWLLVGTLLALIASIKLHSPRFLETSGWLTFGRVQPAHVNVMIYGWASMAGAAVLLWLASRLFGETPRFPLVLGSAAFLWNLAVAVGTVGILIGERTGVPWLEFSSRAAPMLAIAAVLVGISVASSLLDREALGVHGWYALVTACGFPWLYATAAWLTLWRPVEGVAQAVIAAWYAGGLMNLWFAATGLTVLYALLPRLTGRPVASRGLAALGFWLLVLLGVWTGGRRLVGGPVPAWVVTISIVAVVLLLIHVAAVAINLLPLLTARSRPLVKEPAFGFLAVATVVYVATGALEGLESLRSVSRILHFTHAEVAQAHLTLVGSFTMAIFGAVYLVLPRLSGRDWSSRLLIRIHFWCSTSGVLLAWAILTAGGIAQGLALNDPETPFIAVVRRTVPFLMGRTAAGVVMALGNLLFAFILLRHLCPRRNRIVVTPDTETDHETSDDLAGQGTEAALATEREGEQ